MSISKLASVTIGLLLLSGLAGSCAVNAAAPEPQLKPGNESPLDLVNALHTAFGEHHARAVHTKGVMFSGHFNPAASARTLTKAPVFQQGERPIIARFSLFAGVPDIPDTDGAAAPTGLAIKITAKDGTQYDFASDQHNGFVVATSDEFAEFLRAIGASGPGVPHPTPVEKFLSTHPIAKKFVESLTSPESYARATYFGINSFKLTNSAGRSSFVRYRYVPRAGERYLSADELKTRGPDYLEDEIARRIAESPVVFDWYAQVAEPGDRIEDPSLAWPESRKLVKLGTFTIDKPIDDHAVDKRTVLLVGQSHPGIDPADPMLVLRNSAYPISLGQRQ